MNLQEAYDAQQDALERSARKPNCEARRVAYANAAWKYYDMKREEFQRRAAIEKGQRTASIELEGDYRAARYAVNGARVVVAFIDTLPETDESALAGFYARQGLRAARSRYQAVVDRDN